jgi:hypothetical protein
MEKKLTDHKITLFFVPKKISLMYSLFPIFNSKYKDSFKIVSDFNYLIEKDKNELLFIVGWQDNWSTSDTKITQLLKLREKYRKIAFFEDNASSESELLGILPSIDLLYKRTVYVDKTNYQKEFSENRIFSEFYKDKFNLDSSQNEASYPRIQNIEDLKKIKLAWNIGFGTFPLSKNRNKVSSLLYKYLGPNSLNILPKKDYFRKGLPTPTIKRCQARFDFKGYGKLVGYQRELFLKIIDGNPNFLTGRISPNEYNKEIKLVSAILSPFGWGEVCFRDFEAIFSGAVLVKPDMSHLETYPNIFQNDISYLPINWDGSDLKEKVQMLFLDESKIDELRSNAWQILKNEYSRMDEKVLCIINEIKS